MGQSANEISVKKRIVMIDNFRGLALIYMVFFHFVYDMAFIVESEWGMTAFLANSKIVIFDTASFILLAGISSALSRSNLKRGGRLLVIGILFTMVTVFLFPDSSIYFGILQLLGTSMVLYGAFEDTLKRLPAAVMIAACVVMFALTYNIQLGFVGIKGLFEWQIPWQLTVNELLYPYGFVDSGLRSVDYEPLLPWFFLYFGGTYIGGIIVKHNDKLPSIFYSDPLPPLSLIGRHSLLIYILHQPIIMAVLLLLQFIK